MALFQKIGGLKISVTKKGNQRYLMVAAGITLVLLVGTGYSIWYSASVLQTLFVPISKQEKQSVIFEVSKAAGLEKLQDGYWQDRSLLQATSSPAQ